MRIWNLSTGDEIRAMQGHQRAVWSVVFTPDGRHILSGGYDQVIKVWAADSGREIDQR